MEAEEDDSCKEVQEMQGKGKEYRPHRNRARFSCFLSLDYSLKSLFTLCTSILYDNHALNCDGV